MRFVIFGCSHTYGEGITRKDTGGFTGSPSPYAWPNILRSIYKIPVKNYARCGASNHYILKSIRDHKWQKKDIAIVLFTYPTRYSYYTKEKTCENILPNIFHAPTREEKVINNNFYKTFTDYHIEKVNLIDVEHAYLFLKYNNIPYVNRFCSRFTLTDNEISKEILNDSQTTIKRHAQNLFTEEELTGFDGAHYSKKVHQTWAKYLQQFIDPIINDLQHLDNNQ